MRVRLDSIAFDAGTQIRAALDSQLVTDYAEAMTSGASFPPIVLFHDGIRHYLADGFHRFMAAQRNDWREIDAEVQAGTKDDALWFALGANRKNGKRLTSTDLQHAIKLAFQAWPDKSANQIAAQVGCTDAYVGRIKHEVHTSMNLPDRVTGKDGKSYPASKKLPPERIADVEEQLRAGVGVSAIAAALKMNTTTIRKIQSAAAIPNATLSRSRQSVAERREQMRTMAGDGYTSPQIAAALGLSEEGCRTTLKDMAIDVPGDRATRNNKRHDSNRIVDQMVADAENLTSDVNLIDFATLDRERVGEWADSLIRSRKALDAFVKRLIKEQQKHGEAA